MGSLFSALALPACCTVETDALAPYSSGAMRTRPRTPAHMERPVPRRAACPVRLRGCALYPARPRGVRWSCGGCVQKQKAAPQVVENAATLRLKLDEASPPARPLPCSMRPHESMRSHGHLCVVLAVPAGPGGLPRGGLHGACIVNLQRGMTRGMTRSMTRGMTRGSPDAM